MHLNKLWYYWIDEYDTRKYWRKFEGSFDEVKLLTEEIITEHQCKIRLKNMFPYFKVIKTIPYHYSHSPWGSRPVKCKIDRKGMLKEKNDFRKELEEYL